jgi:DNA invertase Pin-like site-specific DNA recombinase
MPLYGHARLSTIDQDICLQRAALKVAGCDMIRAEKASGSRRDGRTELQVLLDFVRPGDTQGQRMKFRLPDRVDAW